MIIYLMFSWRTIPRLPLTGSTPFSLMYGRALNKFEKYGRTKTKGDLSLVLWKKKQTEISEVIYPAVKDRVMQEKKKDDR